MTRQGFRIYSLSYLICGFSIFGSAFFTALNNGLVSAVISFARTLVFQIICVLVLPLFLELNARYQEYKFSGTEHANCLFPLSVRRHSALP